MKWRIPACLMFFATLAAAGQSGDTPPAHPALRHTYRELYEEGYYEEAIRLLDSLVLCDSSVDKEKFYYLAACQIASGDREKGAVIFAWILADDPTYALDTLLTPPKILQIFQEVRSQHLEAPASTYVIGEGAGIPPAKWTTSSVPKIGTVDTVPFAAPIAMDRVAPREQLRRALAGPPGFGLLPFGAGHFLRHRPVKGALLCAAQVAALGICIWSFGTREKYYDERYGWYQENRAAYDRYTGYTRAGTAAVVSAYAAGIIDYFYGTRKPDTVK